MDYQHGYGQGNQADSTSRFPEMLRGESGLMASSFGGGTGFGAESTYGRESAYDMSSGYGLFQYDRKGSLGGERDGSGSHGRGGFSGNRENIFGGEGASSFGIGRGKEHDKGSLGRGGSGGRGGSLGRGSGGGSSGRGSGGGSLGSRGRDSAYGRGGESAYGRGGESAYGRGGESAYGRELDSAYNKSYDGEDSYSGQERFFDSRILDSMMKRKVLEEQLSARERELAYANSLLHQKHQEQQTLYKRHLSEDGGFQDFKRPRYSPSYGPSPNASGSYGGGGNRKGKGSWNTPPGRTQGQGSSGRGGKGPADNVRGSMQTSQQGTPSSTARRCTVCLVAYRDEQHQMEHKASLSHRNKVLARNKTLKMAKDHSRSDTAMPSGSRPSPRAPSPPRRAPSPPRRAPSPPRRAPSPPRRAHSPPRRTSSSRRYQNPPWRTTSTLQRRPVITLPRSRNGTQSSAARKVKMPDHQAKAQMSRLLQMGCDVCEVEQFASYDNARNHRNGKRHKKALELLSKRKEFFMDANKEKEGMKGLDDESILANLPAFMRNYDPTILVGQKYMKKTTGWFCKLCDKFYEYETPQTSDKDDSAKEASNKEASNKEASNKEASDKEASDKEASNKEALAKKALNKEEKKKEAMHQNTKDAHCTSLEHFLNCKRFFYNKLKEKAEQEAKAKALEENAKMLQEELEAASVTEAKVIEICSSPEGEGEGEVDQAEIEMMEELNEEELEADAVMEGMEEEEEEGRKGEEGEVKEEGGMENSEQN